ncbi:MG2 domain-containing protein [Flavobacterium palustre]|uniref:MG2 domain-containing protein n=1 Tax=Flavobacterium palustre TaxID=1476463 RepID=UPI00166B4146|nr:MG2 domain-containing protein [Flavobacterium palustre]
MRKTSNSITTGISIFLFWILCLLPRYTWAQENIFNVSNTSFAEKIYLQLDRKVYTNGDTVWFKCIVANASEHFPSPLSGVLYLELIDADEVIRQKKIIKIENGIGQGSFELDKKILKGNYLIRAYTQWNQNFDNTFVFEEYIQVFPTETLNTVIENVKLVKDEAIGDHLEVFFNPQVIDSLQKNKLNVYVTIDDKKDSLLIKKGKNDKYILDYTVEKESQFATIKIETENQKNYTKTFVLNKDYLDLQFFPESGELVHGLSSKVGFKALDANGKGKYIEGEIIDEQENSIASFKSNSLGMGSFFIANADHSKKYYARLKVPFLNKNSIRYPLPNVAATGNTLAVNKQDDKVLLKVSSNYMKNDSIIVQISFRGIDVYEKKVALNQGFYQSLLATDQIPEGIIAFSILDNSKNPIARRLYFNEKPQSRLKINLSVDKQNYSKRELTHLDIQTSTFDEKPVKSSTSLLVINKEELGTMQSLRQNILSYFLINSELKGNIENPGYYFKDNNSNFSDLDVLLLTQGWSKYNYSKPNPSLAVNPEKSLTLSGRVNKLFSEKKGVKDIQLTLMTNGKNKSFYTQATDSLGRFNFNLNDEYGKEIEVLIQTNKNSDRKVSNSVVFDQKKSPAILFERNKSIEPIDSIVEKFINKSKKQKEIEEKFKLQFGGILLDQVTVSGKMAPNKQKVTEKYGKPNTIISGKEILSKEKKWSYGLYSVLLFNYPDKVRIERMPDQNLYATVNNEATLVLVDGIAVPFYDYVHIPNISPSEVKSFEIIEYASGFSTLFCEVHTELNNCAFIAPPWGNIIAIYTHAGIGLAGAQKSKGLTKTTIPVFATPQEFYAPKYENIQPDSWQHPDIRTLIHWQPILNTDDSGKAAASFYNADNKGEIMVVVEAISDTGEMGYQELNYEIKD